MQFTHRNKAGISDGINAGLDVREWPRFLHEKFIDGVSIVNAKTRSAIPFSDYGHRTAPRDSAFLEDPVGFELINAFVSDLSPGMCFMEIGVPEYCQVLAEKIPPSTCKVQVPSNLKKTRRGTSHKEQGFCVFVGTESRLSKCLSQSGSQLWSGSRKRRSIIND